MKRPWMLLVVVATVFMMAAADPDLQLRPFNLGKNEIGLYGPMYRAGCNKLQLDAVMKTNNFNLDSLRRMHVGDRILIPQGCEAAPSAEVAKQSMVDLAAENARIAKLHAAVSAASQPAQVPIVTLTRAPSSQAIVKAVEKSPRPQPIPASKASIAATVSLFWPKAFTMIICFVLGAAVLIIFEVYVPIFSRKKFEEHLSEIRDHGLDYQRSDSWRCVGKYGCGSRMPGDQIGAHYLKPVHSELRMKVIPTEIVEYVTSPA